MNRTSFRFSRTNIALLRRNAGTSTARNPIRQRFSDGVAAESSARAKRLVSTK